MHFLSVIKYKKRGKKMRSKNKRKNELVKAIIDAYQPETAKDVQEALKDVFSPIFEAMLQGKMNE